MFKEHPVFIPMPIASAPISSLIIDQHPIATIDDKPIDDVNPIAPNVDPVALDLAMDIPLRRLKKARRPTISYDYFVYLQEHGYDVVMHHIRLPTKKPLLVLNSTSESMQ